jgi:hypothetical protein
VADGPGAHVVLLDLLTAQGMRDDQVSIPLQYPVHLLQGQRLVRKMGEGPETDDMAKEIIGEGKRFDGRKGIPDPGFVFEFFSADLDHLLREIDGPNRPFKPDGLKKVRDDSSGAGSDIQNLRSRA